MAGFIRKRSVVIDGHSTSYSIEDEFQQELVAIAAQRGVSLAKLIAGIDHARTGGNLSSALRLFVLDSLNTATGRSTG